MTYDELSSVGAQGRRRGVCDLGVDLLAQAGNTHCAHDCAVYAYRHAATQYQNAGSNEGRSTQIYVVLDLRRRPLQPCRSSCLLDGEIRACRADTIHPLESKQIPGGINHCDCRGRIALLRALSRGLQDRLRTGLIERHDADGLRPDGHAEDRGQYSNTDCNFRHSELISFL